MSQILNFGREPNFLDEPHLAPYEKAARLYCARIGVDPDGVTEVEHPQGLAVPTFRAAWCFAADKLIDLSHMLVSMREAQGTKEQ